MKWKSIQQQGFTLVELLATMVILTFVIALIASPLVFGTNTLFRGEKQSHIQDEIRIASHIISDHLRYASEVAILDTAHCPVSKTAGFHYICVDATNKAILHYVASGTSHMEMKISPSHSDIEFELAFEKIADSNLAYRIEGRKDAQRFVVESNVQLLNVDLNFASIAEYGTSDFRVVRYQSAPSP